MKELYNRKFSIAHSDIEKRDDDRYFKMFVRSSDQFKKEIYDIYFGGTFAHRDAVLTNVMGVQPTENQYKNLLKIQEKYNVPISLTLNSVNRPMQMIRADLVRNLISYIKKFYDDGVRSCTMSHVHLMRLGALQSAFPDMKWKNTVNHEVRSAQEFIDYVALGYNTIQLDRSLNRNISELKRIKEQADIFKVETSLLITENCMPECPFKNEHDSWQDSTTLVDMSKTYWDLIKYTCRVWRGTINPRTGIGILVVTQNDWREYAELVDIFKTSGRLTGLDDSGGGRLSRAFTHYCLGDHMLSIDSFKTAYDSNVTPLYIWFLSTGAKYKMPVITDIEKIKDQLKIHIGNSDKFKNLVNVLKNCKNQCYKCHKCDDLFLDKRIHSILQLENQNGEPDSRSC